MALSDNQLDVCGGVRLEDMRGGEKLLREELCGKKESITKERIILYHARFPSTGQSGTMACGIPREWVSLDRGQAFMTSDLFHLI